MNITVIQNKSQREILGSGGANIIEKLYELATDSNNSLTLEGWIKSSNAYGYLVDYLNTHFNDLEVETDNRYIYFEDPNILSILLANNIGDGVGITESQAAVADFEELFKSNTTIEYFDEFKYFIKINKNPSNKEYFSGCTNLKSIDLSLVEYLTAREFRGCSSLTGNINLSNLKGFVNLGREAFGQTAIIKISSLGTITNIPIFFCSECYQLTEITIPNTCTSADNYAFNMCLNLDKVNGLDNITVFGELSFNEVSLLGTNISLLQNATTIRRLAFHRSKISGELNLPNLTLLTDGYNFARCPSITKVISLGSITSIPDSCFMQCGGLTSVVFPLSLTSIEDNAFRYDSSLVLDVSTLPSSITKIGPYAFQDCTNVTGTLNLPNLTDIRGNAFRNANITSVSNLGSITTLPNGTFFGCRNLTSVLLPSTLITIDVEAFSDTAITRLLIPEGVTTIQDSSFLDCSPNISYVELPSTISNINFLFHRMFEPVSASDSVVVVIKATTPPQARYYASWAADNTNVTKCRGIYVPDASVSAYTSITDSDSPWSRSDVKAKIYPISLLLTDSPSGWQIYIRT